VPAEEAEFVTVKCPNCGKWFTAVSGVNSSTRCGHCWRGVAYFVEDVGSLLD
jgi:ribosomal protein S27E